jgi:hypothetical protein
MKLDDLIIRQFEHPDCKFYPGRRMISCVKFLLSKSIRKTTLSGTRVSHQNEELKVNFSAETFFLVFEPKKKLVHFKKDFN